MPKLFYALIELCETLKAIYEFYLPQAKQENLSLSQPKQVRVKYGTRIIRPEFPIVYDEE